MIDFLLGGFRFTGVGWLGGRTVYVDFVTAYTDKLFQLYAGRERIGTTQVPGQRRVSGRLDPEDIPAPLTVIAVDPDKRLTDYGPRLPDQPWNRYELQWSAASYPADASHFQITAGTTPGGAVDPLNVLGQVLFIGDGNYKFQLPPVSAPGTWNYAVTPRDDAKKNGNAGTPANLGITALVPPKDVSFDSEGNRFSAAIAAGVATVDFNY